MNNIVIYEKTLTKLLKFFLILTINVMSVSSNFDFFTDNAKKYDIKTKVFYEL